jgi:hypothetical protein
MGQQEERKGSEKQRSIPLLSRVLNNAGAPPAIVVTVLWFIIFYGHRQYFAGIFVQQT